MWEEANVSPGCDDKIIWPSLVWKVCDTLVSSDRRTRRTVAGNNTFEFQIKTLLLKVQNSVDSLQKIKECRHYYSVRMIRRVKWKSSQFKITEHEISSPNEEYNKPKLNQTWNGNNLLQVCWSTAASQQHFLFITFINRINLLITPQRITIYYHNIIWKMFQQSNLGVNWKSTKKVIGRTIIGTFWNTVIIRTSIWCQFTVAQWHIDTVPDLNYRQKPSD